MKSPQTTMTLAALAACGAAGGPAQESPDMISSRRPPRERPPSPHPPVGVIRCFAEGAASAGEGAIVMAHLLRGCATCSRIIRDVVGLPW
jgi:hypothetical protein